MVVDDVTRCVRRAGLADRSVVTVVLQLVGEQLGVVQGVEAFVLLVTPTGVIEADLVVALHNRLVDPVVIVVVLFVVIVEMMVVVVVIVVIVVAMVVVAFVAAADAELEPAGFGVGCGQGDGQSDGAKKCAKHDGLRVGRWVNMCQANPRPPCSSHQHLRREPLAVTESDKIPQIDAKYRKNTRRRGFRRASANVHRGPNSPQREQQRASDWMLMAVGET